MFDEETQVSELNSGQWRGFVHGHWNIGDNPNGGYLVSIAQRAMRQNIPHADPLSTTTHFLRPGVADEECVVDVDVVRIGRSMSTVRATLLQQGKARLTVLSVFGDLSQSAGVEVHWSPDAPSVPAPDTCELRSGETQGIHLPILERLEVRLKPEHARAGSNSVAELWGWIRHADGRDADVSCLSLFADAFPPSPFTTLGVVGWVPTVELTTHVRARPAPGWIKACFQTQDLKDGRMIEDGRLWDSSGQLVAQSRQLGLVMAQD